MCAAGRNPFEGYVPEVPEGEKLDYGSAACNEFEDMGAQQAITGDQPVTCCTTRVQEISLRPAIPLGCRSNL